MKKLEKFDKWRREMQDILVSRGYFVDLHNSPPCDNNSQRLEFKNDWMEAVIVAWERGDVDFEAYNLRTGEFVFADKQGDSNSSLEDVCNAYMSAILEEPFP